MKKKILFIGNIANNSFLIAELLNSQGIHVDVMCDDYFHCMAYPEWENIAFGVDQHSQIKIDKSKLNKNYERPKWFAQGNRDTVLNYLISKNNGDTEESILNWQLLENQNFISQSLNLSEISTTQINVPALNHSENPKKVRINRLLKYMTLLNITHLKTNFFQVVKRLLQATFTSKLFEKFLVLNIPFFLLRRLVKVFYGEKTVEKIKLLTSFYDEIILFGPSAIWAAVLPTVKIRFFEHGTIRYANEKHDLFAKILSRVYKRAEFVFITNGDVYSYLHAIPRAQVVPTIHPIKFRMELEKIKSENILSNEIKDWESIKRAGYLFCPVRQDWDVKGIDFYVKNLDKICEMFPNIIIVLTKWGNDLEKAINLINGKFYADRIRWINTYSRPVLAVLMQHSILVLDQTALPHFGSTAPQALAMGAPVVAKYDPASTSYIFEVPAPIFSIETVEDLLHAISYYLEPSVRIKHSELAVNWVEKYHSEARLMLDFESIHKE